MPLEGTFLTHVKETVTIMRPMKSVYPRGVASKEKQAPTFSIRLADSDKEAIEAAAAALEMDKTAFIRWTAVATALEILKQKKEYDEKHKAG